jgi:hypothetical protein
MPVSWKHSLRDKDVPILASAIAAGVDYLVTGDSRNFGAFLERLLQVCWCCGHASSWR